MILEFLSYGCAELIEFVAERSDGILKIGGSGGHLMIASRFGYVANVVGNLIFEFVSKCALKILELFLKKCD